MQNIPAKARATATIRATATVLLAILRERRI